MFSSPCAPSKGGFPSDAHILRYYSVSLTFFIAKKVSKKARPPAAAGQVVLENL